MTDHFVLGRTAGALVALNLVSYALETSVDHGITWTTRTASAWTVFGEPVAQVAETDTHLWVMGNSCAIWRTPLGNWSGWEDVTPPDMPSDAIGRPLNLLATTSGAVLVGVYNAATPGHLHVFRWGGSSWATVIDSDTARHVHAVQESPSGDIWASTGDAGSAGTGLWRSTDDGVSFSQVASGGYGIAMAFPTSNPAGVPARILLGSDGAVTSLVLQYIVGESAMTPLIGASRVADGGGSWAGAGQGVTITPEGHLWWISDGENGAIGPRRGIWLAPGPWHKSPVLLEELGATPTDGTPVHTGPYYWYRNWRMTLPTVTA